MEIIKSSADRFINLNYMMSKRFEDVVSCLEEAVVALNPKYSYNPGKLLPRFLFWFLCRLPKPLADIAIDECRSLMEEKIQSSANN